MISISAIVGDLPEDLELLTGPDDETTTETPDTSSDCALMSEPLTQAQSIAEVEEDSTRRDMDKQPIATALSDDKPEIAAAATASGEQQSQAASSAQPTREPDTQQDASKQPADGEAATASQEQRDNNVNEVCPWEDE